MKKVLFMMWLVMGTSFAFGETMMCVEVYQPVCAVKNWEVKTYSNDCFAKVAWAQILHEWMCTGLEKYNMIKKLKYITGDTKKLVDSAIEKYFTKISNKSILEQIKILKERIKKLQQIREKLQKVGKLNEVISELLFYLEFKFQEKINQLNSKLSNWQAIDLDLLQSVLEETK